MDDSQCIYCREWKPVSAFNREHIIPKMMGNYEPINYVLNRYEVCEECNSHFDRFLESPIGLDSLEGLYRVQNLSKPIGDRHRLGEKRLHFVGQDGIFKGLKFTAKSDKNFPERIHLEIEDAIGIIDDEVKDEYKYYSIDNLCSCTADIRNKMLSAKTPLVFFGYENDIVISALTAKGFDTEKIRITLQKSVQDMTNMKTFPVQITAKIEAIMYRLAAKTMFNFMCYSYGKEYILGHQFDHFRRFIRYGEAMKTIPPILRNGGITGMPPLEDRCHTVSTAWTGISDGIFLCGIISWFGFLTYTFVIQPWVTKDINVLPPNKTIICDNTNRKVTRIPDTIVYFDWPGDEGRLAVPEVIL